MKDLKQKVESVGVQMEKFGRTPMVARVFAYLLLSEPPHRSFDEIVTFLNASKSAISNALSALQSEGSVTYITFSGDRKRYFKIDLKVWERNLTQSAKSLSKFNTIIEAIIEAIIEDRKDENYIDFNNGLKSILEFQVFLSHKIDEAIAEWNK